MQDRKFEAKSERHPDFNQSRKVFLNLINQERSLKLQSSYPLTRS